MTADGILFDLDGTIWDATGAIYIAWGMVFARHPELKGEVTVEKLKSCMGLMINDIGRRLFPGCGNEVIIPLSAECCEIQAKYLSEHGGILYPDVEETLKALSKKHKLFVISNCESGYIEAFLTAHKFWQYFTDFECPGGTGLPKADNIRLVVERNGLKSPVYVGDTQGDYNSASEAGVPFVFASYGFGTVDAAVPAIKSFKELANIFE